MKRKRLDRDLWGFQGFPYYQMRMDLPDYHGLVSLIDLVDGDYCYWKLPLAGKTAVCGRGMCWLQLIPDNTNRLITAMYKKTQDSGAVPDVSIWYVDVIDGFDSDPDGVTAFYDLYLDVIFSPCGDCKVDDRDELEDAYRFGHISREQYERALKEGELIVDELCADIRQTGQWCGKILLEARKQIAAGKIELKKNEQK